MIIVSRMSSSPRFPGFSAGALGVLVVLLTLAPIQAISCDTGSESAPAAKTKKR